jgi:hypothetical protein
LATSWINTGVANYQLRRVPESEAAFRRALSQRERMLADPDDPSLAAVLTNLGGLLAVTKPEEAEVLLRRARRATIAGRGIDHPHVVKVEMNLVTLLEARSRFEDLHELLLEVLPRARAAFGEDHAKVARLEATLGSTRLAGGDAAEAETLFAAALAALDVEPDANAKDLARPLCGLARVRLDAQPGDAMALARRCHDVATERGMARWQVEAACTLAIAGRAEGVPKDQISAWSREAHDGLEEPGLPPALVEWVQEKSGC